MLMPGQHSHTSCRGNTRSPKHPPELLVFHLKCQWHFQVKNHLHLSSQEDYYSKYVSITALSDVLYTVDFFTKNLIYVFSFLKCCFKQTYFSSKFQIFWQEIFWRADDDVCGQRIHFRAEYPLFASPKMIVLWVFLDQFLKYSAIAFPPPPRHQPDQMF